MICLGSCQSKMICPAFQSAFIYNDSTRERLFAYFGEDSLPSQEVYSSKNKYGIIEKVSKRKRRDQMRIVKMEKVFPEKNPSVDSAMLALGNANEEGEMDLDSLVSAAPKTQYHYNVEQENYVRLFGKYLYKPPPPEEEESTDTPTDESTEAVKDETENMSRKERRQARKEAKQKSKEEAQQQEAGKPDENIQEDQGQGDF